MSNYLRAGYQNGRDSMREAAEKWLHGTSCGGKSKGEYKEGGMLRHLQRVTKEEKDERKDDAKLMRHLKKSDGGDKKEVLRHLAKDMKESKAEMKDNDRFMKKMNGKDADDYKKGGCTKVSKFAAGGAAKVRLDQETPSGQPKFPKKTGRSGLYY